MLDTVIDARVEKAKIDSEEMKKGVDIGFQAARNRRE
jgi:hypothetical protein